MVTRIVRYFFDQDEAPSSSLAFEEDAWLPPIRPLVVACAAAIALTTACGDSEDVPSLHGTPDADEVWHNPVAPVPGMGGRVWLPDPEELPAGSLYGVPEEDDYTPPRPWPLAGARPVLDDEVWVAPAPTPVFDDDAWAGARPAPALQPRVTWTDDELPIAVVTAPPEEDFWGIPIPHPWGVLSKAVWEADDFPGTPATPAFEEDAWENPVRPVVAANLVTHWPDSWEWVPAAAVVNLVEDEFWANPVRPVPPRLYQRFPYLPDPEELPPGVPVPTVPKLVYTALGPTNAGTTHSGSGIIGPTNPGTGTGSTKIGPTDSSNAPGANTIIGPTKGS